MDISRRQFGRMAVGALSAAAMPGKASATLVKELTSSFGLPWRVLEMYGANLSAFVSCAHFTADFPAQLIDDVAENTEGIHGAIRLAQNYLDDYKERLLAQMLVHHAYKPAELLKKPPYILCGISVEDVALLSVPKAMYLKAVTDQQEGADAINRVLQGARALAADDLEFGLYPYGAMYAKIRDDVLKEIRLKPEDIGFLGELNFIGQNGFPSNYVPLDTGHKKLIAQLMDHPLASILKAPPYDSEQGLVTFGQVKRQLRMTEPQKQGALGFWQAFNDFNLEVNADATGYTRPFSFKELVDTAKMSLKEYTHFTRDKLASHFDTYRTEKLRTVHIEEMCPTGQASETVPDIGYFAQVMVRPAHKDADVYGIASLMFTRVAEIVEVDKETVRVDIPWSKAEKAGRILAKWRTPKPV